MSTLLTRVPMLSEDMTNAIMFKDVCGVDTELFTVPMSLHDFVYFQNFTASQSNSFIININNKVILKLGRSQWAQMAPSPFPSPPVGGSHL